MSEVFGVTEAEWTAGSLTEEKLAKIQTAFEKVGFAVVGGLVSNRVCDLVLEGALEDVKKVREKPDLTPHEKHTAVGHLQLGARRSAPYVDSELVANDLIESVVTRLINQGAWLGFYSGNVNCPDSGYQPLHFDRPFSWKTEAEAMAAGQSWPPPTTTVSCSIALSEITEDCGATEIYPGTHLETEVTHWKTGEQPERHPELVEKWAPPQSMLIPKGGVCFRDPRMWHRGVKNPSDTPRPMIALTYHSELAKHQRGTLVPNMTEQQLAACESDPRLKLLDDGKIGDGRLVFDGSAAEAFSKPSLHGVYRNARFVEKPKKVNHFKDAHLLGGARVVESEPVHPYPKG